MIIQPIPDYINPSFEGWGAVAKGSITGRDVFGGEVIIGNSFAADEVEGIVFRKTFTDAETGETWVAGGFIPILNDSEDINNIFVHSRDLALGLGVPHEHVVNWVRRKLWEWREPNDTGKTGDYFMRRIWSEPEECYEIERLMAALMVSTYIYELSEIMMAVFIAYKMFKEVKQNRTREARILDAICRGLFDRTLSEVRQLIRERLGVEDAEDIVKYAGNFNSKLIKACRKLAGDVIIPNVTPIEEACESVYREALSVRRSVTLQDAKGIEFAPTMPKTRRRKK
jgi:hypothetical protein